MSERRDIQEAILKNWANLGYITSSRINDQLFLDDESLDAYLEAVSYTHLTLPTT